MKRGVVVAVGALLAGEGLPSGGFALGAMLALLGCCAYALANYRPSKSSKGDRSASRLCSEDASRLGHSLCVSALLLLLSLVTMHRLAVSSGMAFGAAGSAAPTTYNSQSGVESERTRLQASVQQMPLPVSIHSRPHGRGHVHRGNAVRKSSSDKQEAYGRLLGATKACERDAMRQRAEQSALLKANMADPTLETALKELQAEAESVWQEGMRDRNGRKDPILGSIRSDPAALHHYSQVARQPGIRRICEVGYNWGASALVWLHSNPAVSVISFDLAERAYTNNTFAWLQRRYGGRLTLVRGNSTLTIPAWAAANPDKHCDLVLVDGDHSYAGELSNLKLFSRLAPQRGARYIMVSVPQPIIPLNG